MKFRIRIDSAKILAGVAASRERIEGAPQEQRDTLIGIEVCRLIERYVCLESIDEPKDSGVPGT